MCGSMMIAGVCLCEAEECGCEGGWEYGCMCVFADGGVGWVSRMVVGVWCGVRQVFLEQAWSGGRSCDCERRAALDVADDIGVRVRLDGVMGVWVL